MRVCAACDAKVDEDVEMLVTSVPSREAPRWHVPPGTRRTADIYLIFKRTDFSKTSFCLGIASIKYVSSTRLENGSWLYDVQEDKQSLDEILNV